MFLELTAADVMSKPAITLDQRETTAMAWELLRGRPFGHLVIVNGKSITGILDARQLIAAVKAGEASPHLLRPLAGILSKRTLCVTPEANVRTVIEVMIQEHYDAIPVASPTGRPIGVITATDILRCLAREMATTTEKMEH
ncbi:MAG: CBS domain-containing protein [Corynebacteriales bacterium]|nr:CBS domain-containing protein [Mycobacteriales bacterium]